MATKGKEVASRAANDALEVFEQLASMAGGREISQDRPKIELPEIGMFVFGRLAAIREFEPKTAKDKPQRVLYLDTPNHSVRMNCNSDLANKVSAELVGNWIGIQRVGTKDTGHSSGTPMTVYRVVDFGPNKPPFVKDDSDATLHFADDQSN